MKIKTSELTGATLDWAVAKCEGRNVTAVRNGFVFLDGNPGSPISGLAFCPSTDWSQGGPIIERENIELSPPFTSVDGMEFPTWHGSIQDKASQMAYTVLGAAMRCFVASKLGDEVDVPDGLSC